MSDVDQIERLVMFVILVIVFLLLYSRTRRLTLLIVWIYVAAPAAYAFLSRRGHVVVAVAITMGKRVQCKLMGGNA